MELLRQEHPTPQWERKNWRNLNGPWEFDFDFGKSSRERKLYTKGKLSKTINVPFCPESKLSGIHYTDFMAAVCYRKIINLSDSECGKRVLLHFGAVDYESFVYINGVEAGHHIGGFSSFVCDITNFIKPGENEIFVIAEDDIRSGYQAGGKQCAEYASHNCFYTRVTGIWQTVWLEFVPKSYIKYAHYYPNLKNSSLTIIGEVCGEEKLNLKASYLGTHMGDTTIIADGVFTAQIDLKELHLWEIGNGRDRRKFCVKVNRSHPFRQVLDI